MGGHFSRVSTNPEAGVSGGTLPAGFTSGVTETEPVSEVMSSISINKSIQTLTLAVEVGRAQLW